MIHPVCMYQLLSTRRAIIGLPFPKKTLEPDMKHLPHTLYSTLSFSLLSAFASASASVSYFSCFLLWKLHRMVHQTTLTLFNL